MRNMRSLYTTRFTVTLQNVPLVFPSVALNDLITTDDTYLLGVQGFAKEINCAIGKNGVNEY
jgi:hypothetical protein